MGFPCLKFYLLALGRLTEDQAPLQRQLRAQRQSVSYLMGDTSGVEFGLVLWGQGRLVSESGEFTSLYQGRFSNFQKGDNLTTRMEESVASGELKDV